MKLKKLVYTLLTFGLLSLNANADSKPIKYMGPTYEIKQGRKVYSGTRCTINRVTGWCISDSKENFITNPDQYSDLAFSFEAMGEAHDMAKSVNDSKKAFDSAFNAQLLIDGSEFAMNHLSEAEGSLLSKLFTGGSSKTADFQKEWIKEIFKDKQKEIYSMYMDKIESFSDDLLNGRITEEELKTKIKDTFDNCYEYQLKLASSELGRFQKLNQKKNKTTEEYKLMRELMIDGLSRGYMASASLNVINESRTIDKSVKSILKGLAKGSGLDSIINKFAEENELEDILNLEFLENNPDFERASIEGQKMFEKFYNNLMDNNKYCDANVEGSNASKLVDLLDDANKGRIERDTIQKESVKPAQLSDNSSEIRKQKELERKRAAEKILKEIESKRNQPKENKCENVIKGNFEELICDKDYFFDLDCDGNIEKLNMFISGHQSGYYVIYINDKYQKDSCAPFKVLKNTGFGYEIIGEGEAGYNCDYQPIYIWDGNNLKGAPIHRKEAPKKKERLETARQLRYGLSCSEGFYNYGVTLYYDKEDGWCAGTKSSYHLGATSNNCYDTYDGVTENIRKDLGICAFNKSIHYEIIIDKNIIKQGSTSTNDLNIFIENMEFLRLNIDNDEFVRKYYPEYFER